MAIRRLTSHPCGFGANLSPRVAKLHDFGTNLCVDFTLPRGSGSIIRTLWIKTLMPIMGAYLVGQVYLVFSSIRKVQRRLCMNFGLHERSSTIQMKSICLVTRPIPSFIRPRALQYELFGLQPVLEPCTRRPKLHCGHGMSR
jgi:hypothetical protein